MCNLHRSISPKKTVNIVSPVVGNKHQSTQDNVCNSIDSGGDLWSVGMYGISHSFVKLTSWTLYDIQVQDNYIVSDGTEQQIAYSLSIKHDIWSHVKNWAPFV
jgi:hypothetical protein